MAGLTTVRTLGTSQVVKVQHGEDHHYSQAGPNNRVLITRYFKDHSCLLQAESLILCILVRKITKKNL